MITPSPVIVEGHAVMKTATKDDEPKGNKKRRKRSSGEWKPVFIAMMRNTGNIRYSCEAAGINRTTYYKHHDRYPSFRRDCREAVEDYIDWVEIQGHRLISDIDRGQIQFTLKARRPEVYGERRAYEVSGPGGQPLRHEVVQIDIDQATVEAVIKGLANAGAVRMGEGNGHAPVAMDDVHPPSTNSQADSVPSTNGS